MTDGTIACDEELHFEDASDVLTELGSVVSISPPEFSVSETDVTSQGDNCVAKMAPGLIDPGSITATIRHAPGNATDLLLDEAIASKAVRNGKFVYGDVGARYDLNFNGFITAYSKGGEVAPGERRTSSVTIRLRALPTLSAVV